MTARVTLFIDGSNFYAAFKKYSPGISIQYGKLADWIVSQAGGATAANCGAHYYRGYREDQESSRDTDIFLKRLATTPGYFVKREPFVRRVTSCKKCGHKEPGYTEKRVDVRLASDMIHYASVDAYDIAVLVSGDQDFIPAVEAVQRLGKQVYLASWNGTDRSQDLREYCFDEINLGLGTSYFGMSKNSSPGRKSGETLDLIAIDSLSANGNSAPHAAIVTGDAVLVEELAIAVVEQGVGLTNEELLSAVESVFADLLSAYNYFQSDEGYLSSYYFYHKWRSSNGAPVDPGLREGVVDILIANGKVEKYTTVNSRNYPQEALRPILSESIDTTG